MSHDQPTDRQHPAVPADHLGAVSPPGGIDCTAVIADVFLYLDHEGDVDARDRIRAHLDQCTPCFRHYGLEGDVKALIARCCGNDRAPERLHHSIRLSLSHVSADGSAVETTTVETTQVRYRTH